MSDTLNLQDRILARRTTTTDDDPDAFEDCGSFGLLRGPKERAVMLNFKLKTGDEEAFAYALLERVTFDRSVGIVLRFPGVLVTLTGRNLQKPTGTSVSLLEGIHRHRVPWVSELDEVRAWTYTGDVPLVTAVEIAAQR